MIKIISPMKSNNHHYLRNILLGKIGVLSLFFIIVFLLLNDVLLEGGNIMGGDWSLPVTQIQANTYFDGIGMTWGDFGNFFGMRQISLTSMPLQLTIKLFLILGINIITFQKILLVGIFISAAYAMYSLLIFLSVRIYIAILGGIVYITTPLFFDYTIMGWIFVLLVMAILPYATQCFIRSVREESVSQTIIAGILYSISVIQAQSLFWFMIVFILLGLMVVQSKRTFIYYARSLGVIAVIFLALNAYWLLGMILVSSALVTQTDIVNSAVSLGTLGHFSPIEIIRLFGSLFNYQYETIIADHIIVILSSFVLSIGAFGALFMRQLKREIISFLVIALVPVAFYILNFHRDILLHIPFSNIIRDFARFTVLSTFAFSVLFGIFINYLLQQKKTIQNGIVYGLIILWFLSIYPWWSGGLTDWRSGPGSDMRLRTKQFSEDNYIIESIFARKNLDQKALFLPLGGTLDFEDDEKFHGMFQEAQDVFAGYSPIPGVLGISDRNAGYLEDYISFLRSNGGKNILDAIQLTNSHYIVLRENVVWKNKALVKDLLDKSMQNENLKIFYKGDTIIVYERMNYLSHVYVPENTYVFYGNAMQIPFFGKNQTQTAVIFSKQNTRKTILDGFSLKGYTPTLEFKKINPTKYRVRLHGAQGTFPLVFSESFHDGWKAYVNQNATVKNQKNNLKAKSGAYNTLDGNERDQASKDELREYIEKGWVTELGDPNQKSGIFGGAGEKTIEHKKWEDNKEKLDYVEKYTIDFISKNFHGTIQNDNLPRGKFWETWFRESLPEENHLMVNGYANSWVIDANDLCAQNKDFCVKNADGTYDMELVLEFWPQRLFYVGAFVSGLTLVGCLGYLGLVGVRSWRKKNVYINKQ